LRALGGIRTTTPLSLVDLEIDGSGSLKPLVEHVKAVLAGPTPTGLQSFSSPGVRIAYEIIDAGGEVPALIAWHRPTLYGDDADRVEAAINEKLKAYKQPIIVALDLVDVLGEFQAARDAFYGPRPIVVPINMRRHERAGDAHLGPMQNGMLVGRSRNAQRARERLIAVLPFAWGLARSSLTYDFFAQLLGNPADDPPRAFSEFAPIPRFVVSERQGDDTVMMRWEPATKPEEWSHRP
jgi:hypothetical protein